MILLFSAISYASPAWYAPDAAEHSSLELGIGPTVVLRGDTAPAGGRVDLTFSSGRSAIFATGSFLASAQPDGFATLGYRVQVLSGPFHLAPFLSVAGHFGSSYLDNRLTGRLGIALEGGGEHWRADLSLPLFGAAWFPAPKVEENFSLLYPIEFALTIEAGLSYHINPQHRLRLGLVGIFPALSYRYDALAGWLAEVLAGTMGRNSLFQARWGWRW
jgi:hypothetical protein